MPTNRNKRARKAKDDRLNEIPADLLHYLRYGHSREYRRAPGERLSELCSDVVFFFFHEEKLAWLEQAWEKHEALIREGCQNAKPLGIPFADCFSVLIFMFSVKIKMRGM